MTERPLVIIGISGFGREAADVVDATGRSIAGFLDDSPSETNLDLIAARNGKFLGGVQDWLSAARRPHDYLIGIGSGPIRQQMANAMDRAGHHATVAVHPTANVGFGTSLGGGAVVCAGANLSTNVVLGRHAHVNPNATLGHDVQLEDFISINPSATVSGSVVIRARTLIGASATILQNIQIGADVVVGASALVTRNVPNSVVVKGIPGTW